MDQTGARVDGGLGWIHAARTEALTRYTVSARRAAVAMDEAGAVPALSPETVLVSDFWSPYPKFDVIHAVCGAHLGRELVGAAEVEGQAGWADALDRLLREINRATTGARDAGADGLAPSLLATYQHRYDEPIEAGWAGQPRPPRRATADSGDDPNTSTSWTGPTPTATRSCATRATCACHTRTTAASKTSVPPKDPAEDRRLPTHHDRRRSLLPAPLLPEHSTQEPPIRLPGVAHAPRRQPLDTSPTGTRLTNQLSSYRG